MSTTRIDLTGMRFGHWTAISAQDKSKHGGETKWICRCDCGTIRAVSSYRLRNGLSKSCGCSIGDAQREARKKHDDLVGKRFGKLTVIGKGETKLTRSGKSKPYWKCLCDCGNTTSVTRRNLLDGHTRSCGCYAVELRREKMGETYGVTYPTICGEPSVDQIIEIINRDNSVGKVETIEDAVRKMFPLYWANKVRNEQTTLSRRARKRGKGAVCSECGKALPTQMHHIIPVSEYGGNDEGNVVWLCKDCHNSAHKKVCNKGERSNAKVEV